MASLSASKLPCLCPAGSAWLTPTRLYTSYKRPENNSARPILIRNQMIHAPTSSVSCAAYSSAPSSRVLTLEQALFGSRWKTGKVSDETKQLVQNLIVRYAGWESLQHILKTLHAAIPGSSEQELQMDHLAFRTFKAPGLGMESIIPVMVQQGWSQTGDKLTFPGKKLQATWLTPSNPQLLGVLPRIFVSEIEIEKLSQTTQSILHKYISRTSQAPPWDNHEGRRWPAPTWEDYLSVLQESEYAAWVLAHGYATNHLAIALHNMHGTFQGMDHFTQQMASQGIDWNPDGGVVKVSPDGLLLQCSTKADMVPVTFACGQEHKIAGPYIEFVERKVLPQFVQLEAANLQEHHRRDGFETGNADRIFTSTDVSKPKSG